MQHSPIMSGGVKSTKSASISVPINVKQQITNAVGKNEFARFEEWVNTHLISPEMKKNLGINALDAINILLQSCHSSPSSTHKPEDDELLRQLKARMSKFTEEDVANYFRSLEQPEPQDDSKSQSDISSKKQKNLQEKKVALEEWAQIISNSTTHPEPNSTNSDTIAMNALQLFRSLTARRDPPSSVIHHYRQARNTYHYYSVSKKKSPIQQSWVFPNMDEQHRICTFWLSLTLEERGNFVKAEKESLLRLWKEQSFMPCSCVFCQRKRVIMGEEIVLMYDNYARSLEDIAQELQSEHDQNTRYSVFKVFKIRDYINNANSNGNGKQRPAFRDALISIASDLIQNYGRRLIRLFDGLAERRIRYEHGPINPHRRMIAEDSDNDEDSDDSCYEEVDESGSDEEDLTQIEEGRCIFQEVAAHAFQQRIFMAYREMNALENLKRMALEEEGENVIKKDKNTKKDRYKANYIDNNIIKDDLDNCVQNEEEEELLTCPIYTGVTTTTKHQLPKRKEQTKEKKVEKKKPDKKMNSKNRNENRKEKVEKEMIPKKQASNRVIHSSSPITIMTIEHHYDDEIKNREYMHHSSQGSLGSGNLKIPVLMEPVTHHLPSGLLELDDLVQDWKYDEPINRPGSSASLLFSSFRQDIKEDGVNERYSANEHVWTPFDFNVGSNHPLGEFNMNLRQGNNDILKPPPGFASVNGHGNT